MFENFVNNDELIKENFDNLVGFESPDNIRKTLWMEIRLYISIYYWRLR